LGLGCVIMTSLVGSLEAARPFAKLWRAMQSRYVLGGGYLLAAVLTAVAILLAASPPEAGPLRPASNAILTVLSLNLVLILVLAALVGFRLLALLDARSVDAGARLHLRFVTLFALAAVAPAVVVALFYGVLVNRGVDNWFSERVQTVRGKFRHCGPLLCGGSEALYWGARVPDVRGPQSRGPGPWAHRRSPSPTSCPTRPPITPFQPPISSTGKAGSWPGPRRLTRHPSLCPPSRVSRRQTRAISRSRRSILPI